MELHLLGHSPVPWIAQPPRQHPGPLHTACLSLSYRLQLLQQPEAPLYPLILVRPPPPPGKAPAESRTASVELTPCVSRLTRVMVLPCLLSSAPKQWLPHRGQSVAGSGGRVFTTVLSRPEAGLDPF